MNRIPYSFPRSAYLTCRVTWRGGGEVDQVAGPVDLERGQIARRLAARGRNDARQVLHHGGIAGAAARHLAALQLPAAARGAWQRARKKPLRDTYIIL